MENVHTCSQTETLAFTSGESTPSGLIWDICRQVDNSDSARNNEIPVIQPTKIVSHDMVVPRTVMPRTSKNSVIPKERVIPSGLTWYWKTLVLAVRILLVSQLSRPRRLCLQSEIRGLVTMMLRWILVLFQLFVPFGAPYDNDVVPSQVMGCIRIDIMYGFKTWQAGDGRCLFHRTGKSSQIFLENKHPDR